MANSKLVTVDVLAYNNEKIKEQLDKKVNIEQGVDNKGKLLGVDDAGNVALVEAPDGVKVSAETDNQIEQKQDGIYVKDMSAKISAETDNALIQKNDGLYVPTVAEAKVSSEANNIISSKDDGLFAEETITEIQLNNTPLTVTDKKVNIDLSDYENVQSDWDETDTTKVSYIANKPNISNVDVIADDGITVEETRLAYNGENLAYQKEITDLQDKIDILNGDATVNGSVDKKIADANHLTKEIVDTLPDVTDAKENVIYMIKDTSSTVEDVYKEYTLINGAIECIGSTSVDLSNYSTTDEVKELIKDELYVDNVIPAHYEIADSSTPNALEVVADGTATDCQIDLSNVVDIGANIGDFVVFVDEVTTTDSKYAEKSSVYSKSETDEKIAEAVTGGTVSLDGYVQKTELETTLEDYTTDEELTAALADYTKTTELDTKLEDYVLDSEMEIIDVTTLESMLGLSTEELEGLSQIIDDTQIVLNKTYSSSMIYSSIAQCLEDSKAYTLSELAKSIGASYKVVTSVDQMTDSKVLYLLKDADSGMYNIYVYDADTYTAELIGSFEINLDDYLKISDAEAQYVKQTDLVANYATKQEVVDGYATKTELQDAIADVEVEILTDENNQLENRENGLYVGKQYIEITEADYEALSDEEKNNGIPYYIKDANPTQSGSVSTDAETLGGYSADDFAKATDLANYLPLSGGDIKGEGTTPLRISGDNYVACYLDFKRPDSLILGALGFYGDKPVFVPSDYSATRELLHAGNFSDYALPKTGGILTNGLGVANGYASLNGDENAVILGTTSTVDGSGNTRLFRVFNPEYTSSTAQIVDIIDGVHTAYDVIHSGNIAEKINENLKALTSYDNTKTLVECLDSILTDSNFGLLVARDIHVYCSDGTFYCRALRVNDYSIMGYAFPDEGNTDMKSYSFSRRYYNSSSTKLVALN